MITWLKDLFWNEGKFIGALRGLFVGGGVALAALPVATGVAVSRYRLFDLDRLVSRTVTWAVVTVSLILLWSGGVLVVSTLASARASSALPASVATLVTALAAGPILRKVRDAVDRQFRRLVHTNSGIEIELVLVAD